MSESWVALQVVMMPRDANPIPTVVPEHGPHTQFATVFGGVILSHIDMAGAIAARRAVHKGGGTTAARIVTVAINRVEFKQPVLVGDVVQFVTKVAKVGRTSITIRVDVHAERGTESIHVTEAEVVYVGVEPTGPHPRPMPLGITAT